MAQARGPAALFGAVGLVVCGTLAAEHVARPDAARARGAAPLSRMAHVVGPPPGHTGGFGEPTCAVCHLGSELNAPGSTLEVVGLGGTYRPGATYRVTIRLLSFDMNAAGFQASLRWGEGAAAGERAGRVRTLDGSVTVVTGDTLAVDYVQHTETGSVADGERAEWSFEWTAPHGEGVIELHVAANSGNGDNSPLDDLVYTSSVRLLAGGGTAALP